MGHCNSTNNKTLFKKNLVECQVNSGFTLLLKSDRCGYIPRERSIIKRQRNIIDHVVFVDFPPENMVTN